MLRECEECHARYDDARRWTICPHDSFISDESAKRKDIAFSLIGKDIFWIHLPDGNPERVQSIDANGMVTLKGWAGAFSPTLFLTKEEVV